MLDQANPSTWVDRFGVVELPVLARTVKELERMKADSDHVTMAHISDVVMHDPFMTFKVLRFIQQRRHKSQLVDVTTIAHALMMMGLEPFLTHFCKQPTLEGQLQENPAALHGALRVVSRARHAALYAREWAMLRHDIEVDEVTTAALLHDLAELLIWRCEPALAVLMEQLTHKDGGSREAAQRTVLGFPLIALQEELAHKWQLPELLCTLMDERHASTPRALNVSLALTAAQHTSESWDHPALLDNFTAIGRLVGCSAAGARDLVVRTALRAAKDWDWYGVPPAMAVFPASSGMLVPPKR
jgi:HD-like signal output (HDOD) protein